METRNIIDDLKKNDLISYNYLFSNEDEKFGVVIDVKEDLNFGFVVEVLNKDGKISLPASIIEYRKI